MVGSNCLPVAGPDHADPDVVILEDILVHYDRRWLPRELFATATTLTISCAVFSWYPVERRFVRRSSEFIQLVHRADHDT